MKAKLLNDIYDATDDKRIEEVCNKMNINVLLTKDSHLTGTDRVAECVVMVDADYYVNIQGDEPMTHPNMITEAVEPMLNDSEILVTNLLGDIENIEEFEDINCIKVVCDQHSNAIYFSREPIPTRSKCDNIPMKK